MLEQMFPISSATEIGSMAPIDVAAAHVVFACILAATLSALAIIDFHRMILPDRLNLVLAAAGASQSAILREPDVLDAALGAAGGGACLMLVAALFRRLRGVEGLGTGDLKLAAAAGIWIGWQGIPLMLLVASTSALAFFVIRTVKTGEFDRLAPVPFGPFLGLGTFFSWLTTVAR
jgi:leader peptidase (prepilin peptidase) / N-methyltransferase